MHRIDRLRLYREPISAIARDDGRSAQRSAESVNIGVQAATDVGRQPRLAPDPIGHDVGRNGPATG
ncbi:hypothetical protein [Phytoactinopolyspora endophytica]|uniref:hypothetical protein n=1 Tax=Phytoactinopolyspora endophytica TaxID=1642495 RepID=UPI0013ED1ED9|nr:hypothetical protein [Phytoactinopolyspora endophytica]